MSGADIDLLSMFPISSNSFSVIRFCSEKNEALNDIDSDSTFYISKVIVYLLVTRDII